MDAGSAEPGSSDFAWRQNREHPEGDTSDDKRYVPSSAPTWKTYFIIVRFSVVFAAGEP